MKRDVFVHRWSDISDDQQQLVGQIDSIFFQASTVQDFESAEVRAAFRETWLGRYLVSDADWFYVAMAGPHTVVGYLAGSIEDPARTMRFSDLGFYQDFADLTLGFPAHLHVNVDASQRDRGIGRDLIEVFVSDVTNVGVKGVHVVTDKASRNVRFYSRAGFRELRHSDRDGKSRLFMARGL